MNRTSYDLIDELDSECHDLTFAQKELLDNLKNMIIELEQVMINEGASLTAFHTGMVAEILYIFKHQMKVEAPSIKYILNKYTLDLIQALI